MRLAHEPRPQLRVVDVRRVDQLQRDRPVERQLDRLVDDAHAAAPDQRDQAVAGDHRLRADRHRAHAQRHARVGEDGVDDGRVEAGEAVAQRAQQRQLAALESERDQHGADAGDDQRRRAARRAA